MPWGKPSSWLLQKLKTKKHNFTETVVAPYRKTKDENFHAWWCSTCRRGRIFIFRISCVIIGYGWRRRCLCYEFCIYPLIWWMLTIPFHIHVLSLYQSFLSQPCSVVIESNVFIIVLPLCRRTFCSAHKSNLFLPFF